MNILETLAELGGFWHYEGGKYLAKTDDGKVSDVFCNLGVLTSNPMYLQEAARALYDKLNQTRFGTDDEFEAARQVILEFTHEAFTNTKKNFYVCGPAMGGVTLAYEVARQLGGTAISVYDVYERNQWLQDILRGCCDCTTPGGVFDPEDYVKWEGKKLSAEIPEGATVLFVEDVITTGKSTQEMIMAVRLATEERVNVLPYVLCLVDRRGDTGSGKVPIMLDHRPAQIISLADVQARVWDDLDEAMYALGRECDECDQGLDGLSKCGHCDGTGWTDGYMEAVRPNDSWDLLTGGE